MTVMLGATTNGASINKGVQRNFGRDVNSGGPQKKKILVPPWHFFLGGTPGGGGGVRKKICAKNFSGPKKLNFFDFYRTF